MNQTPTFEQIIDAQNHCTGLQNLHWLRQEVFTFQFWLLIALLILPWFLWWKLADKKRFFELLIFGLLVETIVTVLDELGCQLNFWEYRYDIEPLFPRLIPMNFTMLPISYMLIYQYFMRWKTYLIASSIIATCFAFIGEPIFNYLNIYELLNWRHIYSFPIYILLAVIFKLVMIPIIKIQRRSSSTV